MKQQPLSWKRAQSLEDLGELTARWLEGTEPHHPCSIGGGPDGETSRLVSDLAMLNRAGFVTDHSQPGERLQDGFAQRAAASGFCVEAMARRIATLGLWTDLVVIAFPSGCEGGHRVPITIVEHRPYTWAGRYELVELDNFAEACGAELVERLRACWRIDVFDPQWGRERYLWDHQLDIVVRERPSQFDTRPANDALGVDFVW